MIAKGHFLFFVLSLGFVWFGFRIADIDSEVMVDISSLLYLVGIWGGLMTVAFPIKTHLDAVRALLSGKCPDGCHPDHLIAYFLALGHMGLIAGFLGFTIAMATLLERLNSPEDFAPPVAIGIRCLAYGVVVRMIAVAIADRFKDQGEKKSDNPTSVMTIPRANSDDNSRAA